MDGFIIKFPLSNTNQLTIAIKDSIDIAGTPTFLGSAACAHNSLVKKDAVIIKNLKDNHFSIVGKTVMHELAFGMTGVNQVYGTSINPLYPNLIPGGSSSGSATAVANDEADIAIGTDTGGSVRMPAACCGIYGFKPTFGLVSREGVWPNQSSLDCVGVFARVPELITLTMKALTSEFEETQLTQDMFDIGWVSVDANETIVNTVKDALLECSYIRLHPTNLPDFENAFKAGLTVINRETWLACKDFYATGKLGDDVAKRLIKASETTDADLQKAEKIRTLFTSQVDEALTKTRVLALPTLPSFPMTLESALAGETDMNISKFVRPFNLSGHPALSIPCPSQHDLPISLQLIGRKGDDAFICALAERVSASFRIN